MAEDKQALRVRLGLGAALCARKREAGREVGRQSGAAVTAARRRRLAHRGSRIQWHAQPDLLVVVC